MKVLACQPMAAWRSAGHRDDHGLDGGDAGGQHQAAVVAVGHDNAADHAGGHAPAGLVGVVELIVPAGEGDVKGPGEAVTEVVLVPAWRAFRSCIMHSTV